MLMFICNTCGKEFETIQALSGHKRIHSDIIGDFTCDKCGKNFNSLFNFNQHKRSCHNKEASSPNDWNEYKEHICEYCGKSCKSRNSYKQHLIRCPNNPNRIISALESHNKKSSPWNKGLSKDTDDRVKKYSMSISRSLSGRKGHPHSEESKENLRRCALKQGLGGFHMRKSPIKYKGKSLDSSYELHVAKSLDENNIRWQRCSRIPYHRPDGSLHYYTPDFYLIDYDVYLDPKNKYLIHTPNPKSGLTDLEKISIVSEENNINILILDVDHLDWSSIKTLL